MKNDEEIRAKQKIERHLGQIGAAIETVNDFAQTVIPADPAFIQEAVSQVQALSTRLQNLATSWTSALTPAPAAAGGSAKAQDVVKTKS